MAVLPIYSKEGKEKAKLELPDKIFAAPVNAEVLHQAVVMYQACLRQGNASTKERGSVSGGGVKPWRQKGTGRARAGSIRSPLWRGGGVVFGPHPRDFGYSIPRKMKQVALRESLNDKYQTQKLVCVDEIKDKMTKTKEFVKILDALKLKGKILGLLDGWDESIRLVSRNIPRFQMRPSAEVNAYDILRHNTVLMTQTSFKKLLKRIKVD